jgi:ABC-type bacteriocin/lantibiotic exporter with double-glycine peptidase domain
MILESYGHVVSEIELRQRCACDDEGTYPSKIAEVARQYGLDKSSLAYLQLEQLKEELARGLYPVVYLELVSGPLRYIHSVVVIEVTEDRVQVLDPEIGERGFDIEEFNRAWSARNGLTILIE